MARGALDEFPLFWRCANIVRWDITEDVELGCKHRDPVGCRTHCSISEGADPYKPQVACLSASSNGELAMARVSQVEDCLAYLLRGY